MATVEDCYKKRTVFEEGEELNIHFDETSESLVISDANFNKRLRISLTPYDILELVKELLK